MNKKTIIFLIFNLPLTYILIVAMGWLSYFIMRGDPTFLIPLPYLLMIFFAVDALVISAILKRLKIRTFNISLIAMLEAAAVYLFLWFLKK